MPPGHGDIYIALAVSGTLEALLGAGLRYAFVSNSDNLGALADVRIAAWLAAEQVPFALEAVRGTPADRKAGHLARYQGRVVLRETAQVPDGDTSFTDVERWRWYNTNNIWIDLRALADLQATDPAAPALPLIVNRKTVDPRDPASTPVIQLESAMGAAIGSIPGARAVHVPRSRFAPVKTTNDLLVVRSDAYELTDDGQMRRRFDGPGPVVTLDRQFYELLPDFEHRFPAGAPSLRRCRRFEVEGDVTFGGGVVAAGDVQVAGPRHVPGPGGTGRVNRAEMPRILGIRFPGGGRCLRRGFRRDVEGRDDLDGRGRGDDRAVQGAVGLHDDLAGAVHVPAQVVVEHGREAARFGQLGERHRQGRFPPGGGRDDRHQDRHPARRPW